MPRLHDLDLTAGRLPSGPHNTLTDVPGVRVGHHTLHTGDNEQALRTGVTVIVPHEGDLFEHKVAAGTFTLNGFGKAFGLEQVRSLGTLESPIALTNTLSVPRVADALLTYMMAQHPDIGGRAGTVNTVVGECNDGFLSNIRARAVTEAHVMAALEAADTGPVAEGCVGAGTGTTAFAFKAGIGTASRMVADGRYTVGALVQSNFGARADLRFLGVPLGRLLGAQFWPKKGTPDDTAPGSVMVVLATDAPLMPAQLERLCMRAALGLGRTGSYASVHSGDFVLAFSTTMDFPHESDDPEDEFVSRVHDNHVLDMLFLATVEAVEEAVLNSLVAATDTTGLNGRTVYALPHDVIRDYVRG